MNKHAPPILSALIGLIIGLLVFSRNPVVKLFGIVIVVVILLYFRKQIEELFLETEAGKVISILFVAVFVAGIIIIDSLHKTQWQLGILWGAWIIFNISLLGKLLLLITEYEFALETKDREMEHAKKVIEPYLKHLFGFASKKWTTGTKPLNQKEKQLVQKHKDIVATIFTQIPPRVTLCRILSITYGNAYGIAIRMKTDKDDPKFGESLAFKRATKAYLKKKRMFDGD